MIPGCMDCKLCASFAQCTVHCTASPGSMQVLLGCIPFMVLIGAMVAHTMSTAAGTENAAYAEASALAQQSIAQASNTEQNVQGLL
jgi:hypothetical protein